jgi:[NiFe] hydrogenase diaphorase moiety small subunit
MKPAEETEARTVTVRIDGVDCPAAPGEPIVRVAARHGVYVPTLCWSEGWSEGWSEDIGECLGTCRVCTIRWKRHFVAACALRAEPGMELTVDTAELRDIRKGLVELLFVEGNHFCPSCEKSGDCQLQALGYRLGMAAPRFHYRFSHREIAYRARELLFEQNRCIYCKRCSHRFADSEGRRVFAFHERGGALRLEMDVERVDALAPEALERLVAICPVGALLRKGQGFDRPVGTRRYDREPIGADVERAAAEEGGDG